MTLYDLIKQFLPQLLPGAFMATLIYQLEPFTKYFYFYTIFIAVIILLFGKIAYFAVNLSIHEYLRHLSKSLSSNFPKWLEKNSQQDFGSNENMKIFHENIKAQVKMGMKRKFDMEVKLAEDKLGILKGSLSTENLIYSDENTSKILIFSVATLLPRLAGLDGSYIFLTLLAILIFTMFIGVDSLHANRPVLKQFRGMNKVYKDYR